MWKSTPSRYARPVLRAMAWRAAYDALENGKDIEDLMVALAEEYGMSDMEYTLLVNLYFHEVRHAIQKKRNDAIAKLDGGIPDPPEKTSTRPDLRGQEW